jgi:hypothetical protein
LGFGCCGMVVGVWLLWYVVVVCSCGMVIVVRCCGM